MLLGLKASTDQRQIQIGCNIILMYSNFISPKMILPKLDGRILYRWQH